MFTPADLARILANEADQRAQKQLHGESTLLYSTETIETIRIREQVRFDESLDAGLTVGFSEDFREDFDEALGGNTGRDAGGNASEAQSQDPASEKSGRRTIAPTPLLMQRCVQRNAAAQVHKASSEEAADTVSTADITADSASAESSSPSSASTSSAQRIPLPSIFAGRSDKPDVQVNADAQSGMACATESTHSWTQESTEATTINSIQLYDKTSGRVQEAEISITTRTQTTISIAPVGKPVTSTSHEVADAPGVPLTSVAASSSDASTQQHQAPRQTPHQATHQATRKPTLPQPVLRRSSGLLQPGSALLGVTPAMMPAKRHQDRPATFASLEAQELPVIREYSAGGLVFNEHGKVAIIARHARSGHWEWCLPKGHIEHGETPEQTAVREIHEETGILGEIVDSIATIDYWFTGNAHRVHKLVQHYALRQIGGHLTVEGDPDHEAEDARWVAFEDLDSILSYPNERKIAWIYARKMSR